MKTTSFRVVARVAQVASLLLLAANLPAAVTFSVTPATVSNTYNGPITLHISGLNTGESVTVQKFFNLTGGATIPAGSWILQQFNLTDGQAGMVIGGVTNTVVPGDSNPTNGVITAQYNFYDGDFSQTIAGKYFYRLSSPSNHFAAITNPFTVTNYNFPQKFTGVVVSNGTTTPVPNAVVLLFPPNGKGSPVGGTVADGAGNYTLVGPVGSYALLALEQGYAFNLAAAQLQNLTAGITITTNVSALGAPATISGAVEDANTSAGLPGIFVTGQSTNEILSVAFTDASGNFTMSVPSGANQWKIGSDSDSLDVHGYVGPQNKPHGSTGETGLILPVTQGTALLYGTVLDYLNNPLPGIGLYANDDNGQYEYDGITDANGNYFLPALGGISGQLWQVQLDNPPTNFSFTLPSYDENGGTNLSVGEALQGNLTGLASDFTISGTLLGPNSQPLTGIGIYANATVNGTPYFQSTSTDSNGFYTLHVSPGTWTVNANSGTGNGNIPSGDFVASQNVTISNTNATVNLQAVTAPYTISGQLLDNGGHPISGVGIYASTYSGPSYNVNSTTDNNGNYTLYVVNGSWVVGVNQGSGGNVLPSGYLLPPMQNVAISGASAIVNFTAIATVNTISGTLKDNTGAPISGVSIYGNTTINSSIYNQSATTDSGGNFSFGVINGTWNVGINPSGFTGGLPANKLTPPGQSVTVQNNNPVVTFVAINAPYTISGNVNASGTNIIGLDIQANTEIGTNFYSQSALTDANGNYSIPVADGSWTVSVSCFGGLGSLQAIFGNNIVCPGNQTALINNDNSTNNFDIQLCGSVIISSTLNSGEVRLPYGGFVQVTSCNANFTNWTLLNPSALQPGLQFNTNNGFISGTPTQGGGASLDIAVTDGNGVSATNNVFLNIFFNLQTVQQALTNVTNGVHYTQTLMANAGAPPYRWSLASGSGPLPGTISLETNGVLSGDASTPGVYDFSVVITDSLGATATQALSITVISNANPGALMVTLLPNGAVTNGAKWQVDSNGVLEVSGAVESGLAAGSHVVSFSAVTGYTTPANQNITITNGATNSITATYVAIPPGTLTVTILPTNAATAGGEWEVDNNGAYQKSGASLTNLAPGLHVLSFKPISAWATPANQNVNITSGSTSTATGTYLAIGSLQVTLAPAGAIAEGAQWQLDGAGNYYNSGVTLTNVAVGAHTINFAAVNYWDAPANQNVTIKAKALTKATGTYTFKAAGTYNGLFEPTVDAPQLAGFISDMAVTASGGYSAKIMAGSTPATIKGNFNPAGLATNLITRPATAGGNLKIIFNVDWTQTPPVLAGTVSGTFAGGFVENLHAELAATSVASAEYTAVLLPPVSLTPPGYGYFTMSNHLGVVKMVGALSDGTAFMESVPLSVSNGLPIYESLYSGEGVVAGWLYLVQGLPSGKLFWLKPASKGLLYPAGFTNQVIVGGSGWTNPPVHTPVIPLVGGNLTISGGGLAAPLVYNVSVTSSNTLAVLAGSPTNSLSGTISPTTGVLTIKFGNGEGKSTTSGTGATSQFADEAGGFFLTKTNAGAILLTAP